MNNNFKIIERNNYVNASSDRNVFCRSPQNKDILAA